MLEGNRRGRKVVVDGSEMLGTYVLGRGLDWHARLDVERLGVQVVGDLVVVHARERVQRLQEVLHIHKGLYSS
jgi:hypothetical protein